MQSQNLKQNNNVTQVIEKPKIVYELGNKMTVPIQNLGSKKLELKTPLYAVMERNNDENIFIIDSLDLNLRGQGNDEIEAINNFSQNLEELYFELKELGSKRLGIEPLKWYSFLQKIVKEI